MKARMTWIITALALAGCTAPYDPSVPTAVDQSNQLNIKANTVTPVTEAATVVFAPKSVELDARKSPSLHFLNSQGAQRVFLYTPVNDALAEPRELTITRMIRASGVPSTRIVKEVMPNLPANTYRIEAAKLHVTGPACPNWSQGSTQNFYNKPFSQAGCAIVTNMGAMVSDPQDLVHGSGTVSPDATRNAAVIATYKSGGATSSTSTSTSSDATGGGASATSGASPTPQ